MNNNFGMLTGAAIREAVKSGDIKITDFNENQLNPNSYNLRLHPQLKIYSDVAEIFAGEVTPTTRFGQDYLDSKGENPTTELVIPEEGIILYPNVLYIGRTVEETGTEKFIPMLNGRSSGGRLGMNIHICAGFGDIGFDGTWTLEITVVHPLKVYPNMEIAQVSFFTPAGEVDKLYRGKYFKQIEATESRMYRDFSTNKEE